MKPEQRTAQEIVLQAAKTFANALKQVDGKWDTPTPCDGWTVRDVAQHVIQSQRKFLSGKGFELGAEPDLTRPDLAWDAHTAQVGEILGTAGVAEQAHDGYFGPTTIGATMTDFYGWDLRVHTSDVARAAGVFAGFSDTEVEALGAAADAWGPALYAEGICAPAIPVAETASPSDRFLARLGRDPQWTPAQSESQLSSRPS